MEPLEVARMALTDFGVEVQVTALDGSDAWPLTVLPGSGVEETGLGQARGHLSQWRCRCLPEDAGNLAEGDLLTTEDGADYAVHEIIPVPGRLTRIMTIER